MAEKAHITPEVLKWARTSAKMSLETAASKVNKSPEIVAEWEEGKSLPTVKQAEKLAKAYQRPFAVLFLPEIPRDFKLLEDFRSLGSKELSTASLFIIREIQQKQAWLSSFYQENGEEPLPFVGRFTLNSQPATVANSILETLNIDPEHYEAAPMKEWLMKSEGKGIFISRTSFIHSKMKISKEEIQGFAIADSYAPFVFINTDDWSAPQLFTLVHELAHIWIAESGVSNDVGSIAKDKMHPVELFCNEVAANALLPLKSMKTLPRDVFSSSQNILETARKFGVSSYAFIVRSHNIGLISTDFYRHMKSETDKEYENFLKKEAEKRARQKEKDSGPSPFLLRLNRNSRMFTQIVIDAFRSGVVSPTEASSLLKTQTNNFKKFESFIY